MQKNLLASTGCAVALAFALSACGGGGSVGSTPPPPMNTAPTPTPTPTPVPTPTPTPTPPGTYDTAEFERSNGAVTSNAIAAYNAGATGKGIKVGVVDTGVNPGLTELAGKIDPASHDVAGNRAMADEDGHGTAVSGTIAAVKNDLGTHGVAFDATIVMEKADDPGSCADKTGDGCAFYDNAIAAGVNSAVAAGVKVINMSLGGSQPSSLLLSAIQNAVNKGVVVVISAGNDGEDPTKGTNADPFALIPASRFPGQVIIAGALGTNTSQLATFSNRAGTGADWYLAALGSSVRTIDKNGTGTYWSGTSFSAPVISGAVALMAQAFPNLSARDIIDILFTSADDLGAPGVDAVYGHGRLNIARAFQPIGTTSIAGTQIAVDGSNDLPPASGDAGPPKTPGSFGAVILDGYSRAFVVDFAKTLKAAAQDHPLSRSLQGNARYSAVSAGPLSVSVTVAERPDGRMSYNIDRLGIGPEDARASRLIAGSAIARVDSKTAAAFGIHESAKALERRLSGAESAAFLIAKDVAGNPGFATSSGNAMALRRQVGKFGVTLSGETGDVWTDVKTSATGSPYRWTGLTMDRGFGRTKLSAGIGRLDETHSVLGGRMSAALGGGGSSTMFLDLEARHQFGSGISAGMTARRGWTDFAGGKFGSSAYAFDVTKLGVLNGSDRLGFRLSQPLRVENGGFKLWLPTSFDYDTMTATSSWERYSMSPSGREIDCELSYATSVLDGSGWLSGNLFLRKDPVHIANADADLGAAVRFSLGF